MTGDMHHLAAAYVLDALDERERSEFEAHYPTCEICRREVDEFRETAGSLAAASATDPPPDLKASVIEAIGRTPQAPATEPDVADFAAHRQRRFSGTTLLGAVAAVGILVLGAVLFVGLRSDRSPVEEVLAARDARVTTLEPTPDGVGGTFQIVWSAERDQVAVLGSDLPDPGPGRVYELWAIVGDRPVPAGLFDPDDGTLRAAADVVVDPAAWGVTVEPAAGSESPTTPILFFAEA